MKYLNIIFLLVILFLFPQLLIPEDTLMGVFGNKNEMLIVIKWSRISIKKLINCRIWLMRLEIVLKNASGLIILWSTEFFQV